MATSYAHKFGQIIGDALELAVEPFLRQFSEENELYLDKKGKRTARPGKKLTWIDINANKHDLDFVIEKGGTERIVGRPVAFIECAWRRYTKHSKNKAQEIQGAILPLFEKYRSDHPFIGVILAGEFTEGSLKQLQSLGFAILYFPYDTIVKAFAKVGINSYFDENTEEAHFAKQVSIWEKLPDTAKEKVYKEVTDLQLLEINAFVSALKKKLDREIRSIKIWTMYGNQYSFDNIMTAKEFIIAFEADKEKPSFDRFEAQIEYSNGDQIKISYKEKKDMLEFLSHYI